MCEGNFNFNSAKRALEKNQTRETEVAWRKCINYYQHYSYKFSLFFIHFSSESLSILRSIKNRQNYWNISIS